MADDLLLDIVKGANNTSGSEEGTPLELDLKFKSLSPPAPLKTNPGRTIVLQMFFNDFLRFKTIFKLICH